MKIHWSVIALRFLSRIESERFSAIETAAYKTELIHKIVDKIQLLQSSVAAREHGYHGSYKVMVDSYKVFYKLSRDLKVCTIIGMKHMRQK